MANSYGTSYSGHTLLLPIQAVERLKKILSRRVALCGDLSGDLQVCRLICMMMVALVLTFGAVYKLAAVGGVNSFVPEIAIALSALLACAASYRFDLVRRRLYMVVKVLCYATAAWFITLASFNGFNPNYTVGLLFILPGLGVAYSLTLRSFRPLVTFFGISAGAATTMCVLSAAESVTPVLFIASLICISLMTLFVAGSRLDVQRRFRASEERYRAVIEQASDGIYIIDAETLTFLDANRAFCRMMGMSMQELGRLSVADILVANPADDRAGHSASGGGSMERMLRRADGSVVFVELHADQILSGDREIWSVVVHDVTSRREYEHRLVKAKESAEEIARFKSSLLANMSHEIRTPLTSILGWTSVLTEEIPEQHRELVKLIEQSGRRLHNTLDAVLELAQLQANTRKLHPVVVDVNEEVRSVVEAHVEAAERKGVRLDAHLSSDIIWAETDIACLRRILSNVIGNAIKFTAEGHVGVSVRHTPRDVSIRVEDTGVGISDEFLAFLFEEFKQESAGLSRDHEGNGLGLAITRRLVDMLNGRIDVESRRGVGSTFTIHLPMNAVARSRSRVA